MDKFNYKLQQNIERNDAGKLPSEHNGVADSGCWYRIAQQPSDDAICITYRRESAEMVCEALNVYYLGESVVRPRKPEPSAAAAMTFVALVYGSAIILAVIAATIYRAFQP